MSNIKYHPIVFLFFFYIQEFLSASCFAQSALLFQKGNEWFYTVDYEFDNPPIPHHSEKFEITGDTLMTNGNNYWIIEPHDMFGEKYIRNDSQYVYYWEEDIYDSSGSEEKRVFNINAAPQTTDTINWGGFFDVTLENSFQGTLYGKLTDFYIFKLGGLLFGKVTLCEDFGYIRYEDYQDYSGPTEIWSIEGCIIADTLYGNTVDVGTEEINPGNFVLFRNYPNPFNPSTKITFVIPSTDLITLSIYNSLGELQEILIKKELSPGRYSILWNASKYPSGVYCYKIESSSFSKTQKCMLIK